MTNPYAFFIDITIGKSSKNRCSQKKKKIKYDQYSAIAFNTKC